MKWSWLHSSSSRFSIGVPDSVSRQRAAQPIRRARDLAVGVLDRLRLVEDDGVPRDLGELVDVVAQDRIAREHDVGVGIERAARAVVGARP